MKRSPHIPAVEVGRRWSIWPGFILGYLLLVGGCTPVISRQLMDQVDRNLGYRAIAADPAGTKGKMVLLGGTIVQTVPKPGRTEIDLVQKDLDYWDAPRLTDHSEGRFLVISDRFLDPAIFRQGWDVTVAGEVLEPQTRRIGDLEYHYPVIQAQELHLWRPGPPVYPYPYGGPYNWWWRNSPYYPAYPGYPYWW